MVTIASTRDKFYKFPTLKVIYKLYTTSWLKRSTIAKLDNSKHRSIWRTIILLLLTCMLGTACNLLPLFSSQTYAQSSSTYVRNEGSTICIGNRFIEVGFRKDTGALWSIIHKASGTDLRGLKGDPGEGLWDLRLITKEFMRIGPSGIRRSHSYYKGYSVNQTSSEIEITLEWSRVWLENYGEYPARVLASVRLSENSQFANFSLNIQNYGSAAIEEVCYPYIWEVSKLGDEPYDDILIVPEQNGRMFYNPSENLGWWSQTYPSGFLTMQFMAYYDTRSGFYFVTCDREGNTKSFSWDKYSSSAIRIGITHYPAIDFGHSFTTSYDILLGDFSGDWRTAADIYREWAQEQWWARKGNHKTWIQEVSICKDFYCYTADRTRTFEECIEKVREHQDYFNLPTLLNLWGWEKGGAWSYGDYFPPQEGWDKFRELIDEAHKANTRVWTFIGARSIVMDSELWENGTARPYAMVDEHGSYYDGDRYVLMCPYTEFWKRSLKEYVLTLVMQGVDMIGFDGFPWIPPQPCYNASHGHPLGIGGSMYTKAWISILNETKKAARQINPNIVFSGEGGSEIFIPLLDVCHTRDSWAEYCDGNVQRGIASVIPLFNYVYHDCLVFIGEHNLALWKPLGGSSYNRLGLARILVWGEIPSYNMQESLHDPNADMELIDYLRRIGYARTVYARKFLSDSIAIRPVEIASPSVEVRDEAGSRYNVSSLQYSAWVSHDGSVGYILTNIANVSIQVRQAFDIAINVPYAVYLIRDGRIELQNISANTNYRLSFTVRPLDIVLLIFAPTDISPPITKISTTISCACSSSEVNEGNFITTSGTITPSVSGKTVALTYTRPDGTSFNRTVTTELDGSFNDSIKPDAAGTWGVQASWGGDLIYTGATSSPISFTVKKSGCLIATATYESELSPHVQFLREFRDGIVLQTFAGSCFMEAFNRFYYSFSPAVASAISENWFIREVMKVILYPLIGILRLSYVFFSLLSFSPELGILMAGLVASALISIVYVLPWILPIIKFRPSMKTIRLVGLIWSTSATLIALAELTSSSPLMITSTVMFVLTTMCLTILVALRIINGLFRFRLSRTLREDVKTKPFWATLHSSRE